ncbi:MAG: TolC family protein [Saprospiraceae bacterium]|nr:TolC family protein [Saprospiraceae bacterium]
MNRYILALCTTLVCTVVAWGQAVLSLEQAIEKAIQQNPSILIQQKESVIADNNVFRANAGGYTVLSAIGGATYLNNFADVKLRTFQPDPAFIRVDEFGVESLTANLGLQVDHLLYDGGRVAQQLNLLKGLSEVERAKQEVLVNQTILGVADLYLEILKLQDQATLLEESINNSVARIEKMKDRKQFGKANQLDILKLRTGLVEIRWF